MRYSEYIVINAEEDVTDPEWNFSFFLDDRAFESESALWNIVQTFFIALMLVRLELIPYRNRSVPSFRTISRIHSVPQPFRTVN